VTGAEAAVRVLQHHGVKHIFGLRRETGASLDELAATTGWLPRTTRAALSGRRKKGHAIGRRTVEGVFRTRSAARVTRMVAAARQHPEA